MYIPMRFVPGSTQRFQVLTILAFFILGRLSEDASPRRPVGGVHGPEKRGIRLTNWPTELVHFGKKTGIWTFISHNKLKLEPN